ncbi:MAG TPA: hypothetical protein VF804_04225 [Holophagaceae bacterium]
MNQGPTPAPKPAMNPALKWVLIGCGGFLLFVILVLAIGVFLFIRKARQAQAELAAKGVRVDTSHGLKGMAYGMTVGLVRGMEPAVLLALPKEEHPAADKAFRDLAAKGSSFSSQDMHDLDAAMKAYNDANETLSKAGKPPFDPDASRRFVKAIQAIADRH